MGKLDRLDKLQILVLMKAFRDCEQPDSQLTLGDVLRIVEFYSEKFYIDTVDMFDIVVDLIDQLEIAMAQYEVTLDQLIEDFEGE